MDQPILDRLRDLVRADGRSLRQIAIAADVAPMVVNRFMRGKSITCESAQAIAVALGYCLEIRRASSQVHAH